MKKIVITLVLCFVMTAVTAGVMYPFTSKQKQQRFNHLTEQLRCLVCQNETLATSTASLAKDLRDQVYEMVRAGVSDQAIKHYLVKRYGDYVLFEPPVEKKTWVLWYAPFGLLVLGGLIVLGVVRSKKISNRDRA